MTSTNQKTTKPLNQEQIIAGLNQLRQEQRYFSSKISELEADVSEHKLVIETLKEINDQKRKCYRMVGGVLVERNVAEVLVSLEKNREMIVNLVEQFKERMVNKGKEINEYMELYNIRPVVEGRNKEGGSGEDAGSAEKKNEKRLESSSILVSKD